MQGLLMPGTKSLAKVRYTRSGENYFFAIGEYIYWVLEVTGGTSLKQHETIKAEEIIYRKKGKFYFPLEGESGLGM